MTTPKQFRFLVEKVTPTGEYLPGSWGDAVLVERFALVDVIAARAMAASDWTSSAAPWKEDADLSADEIQFRANYPTIERYIDEWWHERYLRFAVAARDMLGHFPGEYL